MSSFSSGSGSRREGRLVAPRRHDLVDGADDAEAMRHVLQGAFAELLAPRGGAVARDDDVVAVLERIPERAFDAYVRRHAGDDAGPDFLRAKDDVEVGALETGIAMLVNRHLAARRAQLRDELRALALFDRHRFARKRRSAPLREPRATVAQVVDQRPEADVNDEDAARSRHLEQPHEVRDDGLRAGEVATCARGHHAVHAEVLLHVDDEQRRMPRSDAFTERFEYRGFHLIFSCRKVPARKRSWTGHADPRGRRRRPMAPPPAGPAGMPSRARRAARIGSAPVASALLSRKDRFLTGVSFREKG